MIHTMQDDISLFFRQFALQRLSPAGSGNIDPQAIKMMMVNHCEEIYHAFSETEIFKLHYQQAGHDQMVEEYKRCFTLLLSGRLP